MGQYSMQITPLSGSVFGANQQPTAPVTAESRTNQQQIGHLAPSTESRLVKGSQIRNINPQLRRARAFATPPNATH